MTVQTPNLVRCGGGKEFGGSRSEDGSFMVNSVDSKMIEKRRIDPRYLGENFAESGRTVISNCEICISRVSSCRLLK